MDADIHQFRLGQIGSPASTLAALAEINTGSLSKHFSDTQRLATDAVRRITTTLGDLEMVKQVTHPLPIDWSDVKALRDIIAALKDRTLTITVVKSAPPTRVKAYSIKLPNGRWFSSFRDGIVNAGFSYQDCSMTNEVADVLIAKLTDAGYTGCVRWENGIAVNVATEIGQVWPTAAKE